MHVNMYKLCCVYYSNPKTWLCAGYEFWELNIEVNAKREKEKKKNLLYSQGNTSN